MTDGAAAVLLMTRREALSRGLPVLGIFRSFAAVGVDPAIMGVGPAVAIPAAVEKVGRWAGRPNQHLNKIQTMFLNPIISCAANAWQGHVLRLQAATCCWPACKVYHGSLGAGWVPL